MKVKNIKVWFDRKEKIKRQPKDEAFIVNQERFLEINGTRFGTLVEEVPEKAETPEKKEAPKKKAK